MIENFEVMGLFYLASEYKCRKYLDIKRITSDSRTPDIMVIMMNPGSSYPLDKNDNNQVASEAVPDKTQDQIMKVMNNADFDYARILNLSDLRTPKSKDLYKFLKSDKSDTIRHSIFNPERAHELNELYIKDVPVIYAWGVNAALNELGKLAVNTIKCAAPIGLKKDGTEYSYYHPLPQVYKEQLEWVEKISNILIPALSYVNV